MDAITLPAKQIDLLNGRHEAEQIAEACTLAFWLRNHCQDTALYHLKTVHEKFSALADALGYTIALKEIAIVEVAA